MTVKSILHDHGHWIAGLYKVFCQETRSKAQMADFLSALNNEVQYLKRLHPKINDKQIVMRAYQRLKEAYERSAEYPVKLTWQSLADFTPGKRISILWAVLQARADGASPPRKRKREAPWQIKPRKTIQRTWCHACCCSSRVVQGRLECCGNILPGL